MKSIYRVATVVAVVLVASISISLFAARGRATPYEVALSQPSKDLLAEYDKDLNRSSRDAALEMGMLAEEIASKMRASLERESRKKEGQVSLQFVRALRLALAKAGDQEQLDWLVGRLQSDNLAVMWRATDDARYVKGPEVIAALGPILSDTRPGGRAVRPSGDAEADRRALENTSLSWRPPNVMAAHALAHIIASPPVPPKRIYSEADLQKWQQWWEQNKDQLAVGAESDQARPMR